MDTAPSPAPDLQSWITALQTPASVYQREALDGLVAHQAEATPLLLDILRGLLADPDGYIERGGADTSEIMYTIVLLSHFREAAAHDLFIEIGRLSDDTLEILLGDFTTEHIPRALLATYAGRLDGLYRLLRDREANGFARTAAARCLVIAAHLGAADRQAVLRDLNSLLVPEEAEADSYFWNGVASAMFFLHPVEYADNIRHAYSMELIQTIMYSEEDIEEYLGRTEEACAAERAAELERMTIQDVHGWVGKWNFTTSSDIPDLSESQIKYIRNQMRKNLEIFKKIKNAPKKRKQPSKKPASSKKRPARSRSGANLRTPLPRGARADA